MVKNICNFYAKIHFVKSENSLYSAVPECQHFQIHLSFPSIQEHPEEIMTTGAEDVQCLIKLNNKCFFFKINKFTFGPVGPGGPHVPLCPISP